MLGAVHFLKNDLQMIFLKSIPKWNENPLIFLEGFGKQTAG
jgi:hypothetical protein